jgi:hypothetical protein
VGSYDRVAEELARYFVTGCDFIILDVPNSPEELEHIHVAVDRAFAAVGRV